MTDVIAFNYWLPSPETQKIATQFISDVEKIITEHNGKTAFPPTTHEDGIHERTYELKPGTIILKMLREPPKRWPNQLKIRHQSKTYEGTALALLCGFNDDNNYATFIEELKMLIAKNRI
ncbi:hypothetical protein HY485_01560 [Candidatus Woesearchaeota archaeon]|nr:hypothetical protein [Candidatus Woesearchaeota archaeon]